MITKKITEVQIFSNGDLGTIIQVQGDEIGQTNVSTLKQDITNSVVSELTGTGGVSLNLVNMKGVVPTYTDLPTENEVNDAYQVEADGLVYVYTESGFQADGDGFVVQPDVNGVVEEGNTQAVSGGEVYDSISDMATQTWVNNQGFADTTTIMLMNEQYGVLSTTLNSDEVISSANIQWEDGVTGVLTFGDYNLDWLAYDSYTITYLDKIVTQPKVTRDSNGTIIILPLKTIS